MYKKSLLIILLVLFSFILFAQTTENETLDPNTGFPVIKSKPFVVFNEGFAISNVTRVIKQESRSNFVFEDFMIGAYIGITSQNMQPLNSTIRLAFYYPLQFKFNDVPQVAKNVIRYAIDLHAGPVIELNMWHYVSFNLSPGLHFMFQNSDRWNFIYLGVSGLAGIELPIAKRWTILINGIASYDFANFGGNKRMEPIDHSWNYQLDLGVRYSRKAENKYSYIQKRK